MHCYTKESQDGNSALLFQLWNNVFYPLSEKLEKKWSGKSLNKNVFGSLMLYNYFFLLKPHEAYCFLTLVLNPHWTLRHKPYSIGGGVAGKNKKK